MNVAELIAELQKCKPSAPVKFFMDFDDLREVVDISDDDGEGNVLIGTDLPPEVYARDYRYERG